VLGWVAPAFGLLVHVLNGTFRAWFLIPNKEPITHAILKCLTVQLIWFASYLGIRIELLDHLSFADWSYQYFQLGEDELLDHIVAIAWAIWKRRNCWVFNNKEIHFVQVLA